MTDNAVERAVLAAAREWRSAGWPNEADSDEKLIKAIQAYEAWLAAQDPALVERGWHEVAAGDLLLSQATGKTYPVLSSLKVKGGYKIKVQLPTGPKDIVRPNDKEPTAHVQRGQDGSAVDLLAHVFSSSGGE